METKKEKSITSDSIYYGIKLDNRYDVKKCEIVYYDEIKKDYITIPFSQWIPIDQGGEISWHKVYKFIYNGETLWDRITIFRNPELSKNNNKTSSNIMLLRFDNAKNNWLTESPELIWQNSENKYLPSTCKILSWNILFDKYETESSPNKHRFKTRLPYILDCIAKINPDIIALQKITTSMLFDQILKHEKSNILRDYYVTEAKYTNYGQVIMTKYAPLSQNIILLYGKKTYLHMTFLDSNDNKIEFCNIHLTSSKQKGAITKRSLQLKTILTNLENSDHCIIAGDFNSHQDIIVDGSSILLIKHNILLDSWNVVNNGDIGYTYDTFNNVLAQLHSHDALPGRFDRILFTQNSFKVKETKIVRNDKVNNIWLSDHYGIVTTLSNINTEINVIDSPEHSEISYPMSSNTTVTSDISLAYVIDIKYWNFINQYRERYDMSYKNWCPHVILYLRYINLKDHHKLRVRITQILDENIHEIKFNEVSVLNHGTSCTVVLIPSKECINKFRTIKEKLDFIIGHTDSNEYIPHISLGNFKAISSANVTAKKIREELKKNKIEIIIKTNQVSLLMKDQIQYGIIDRFNYDNVKSKYVLNFVKKIIESVVGKGSTIYLCGSRAFGYTGSNFDIIVTYDYMSEEMFYKKCLATLKWSPYVEYVENIQSNVETINIELTSSIEINLIYTQTVNNCVKNPVIKSMIEVPNTVSNLVESNGGKMDDFCEKYVIVRKIAGYKKLVGSKYGYLNGISFLILALRLYLDILKNQKTMLSHEKFSKLFFEKYSSYEWKTKAISITPRDMGLSVKPKYCDRFLIIQDLLPPYENVNKTLVQCSWKRTQETLKACHENFTEAYLVKPRIIRDNCVAIKIYGKVTKHVIEYKRGVSSQMWEIVKDFPDIDPDTEWKYNEGNDYYEYRIGVNNVNESIRLIDNINRAIAKCKKYDDVKIFAFYDYN